MIHNELNGIFNGPKDVSKQLTEKDIINKTNYKNKCSGFDVKLELEYNNKIIIQELHFRRVQEFDKTWKVTTLIGDDGALGCVPINIMYETPIDNFPLVKTAAMGMMYLKLTLSERMAYYESLNYELLEKVNGL